MLNINVGSRAIWERTITDEDIFEFAKVSGDWNPIYVDDEYAENTIFGGRIVHDAFLIALISNMIANQLPGPGSILCRQEFVFLKPVRPEDTITISLEILSVAPCKHGNNIRLLIDICNQNSIEILSGETMVLYTKEIKGE